jgi:hypothetical protein
VEIFMKEFLVAPIFFDGSGLAAWFKALKKAGRKFGASTWKKAMVIVEREYGPIDPMLTEDGVDAYSAWETQFVRLRGAVVHGELVAVPAEHAELAIAYGEQMIQQLKMRMIVSEKHPLAGAFLQILTVAQQAIQAEQIETPEQAIAPMTNNWEPRGQEISQLLLAGRAIYLDIDDHNHGRPGSSSPIGADWVTLSHLNGVAWPEWLRVLGSFTARSLTVAAAEYLAGLAVLYAGPPTLLTRAHYPVVRALVESLGQARWILGPGLNATSEGGDEFARHRAARAYLTLCASDQQRLGVERGRSGTASSDYQTARQALQGLKDDASKYFSPTSFTGSVSSWTIEGQRRPNFTDFSKELMELAFLPDNGDVRNPYAYLSGTGHTNLFSIFELATRERHGDHVRHVFTFKPDDAEVVAQFACQIFSIGSEVVTSAHGWDDRAMTQWHLQVQDAFSQ